MNGMPTTLKPPLGSVSSFVWSLYPCTQFHQQQYIWRDLNLGSGGTPLLDADFVGLLLSEFGRGSEIMAVCHMDSRPVAACIVVRSGLINWRTWQPAQAPLGLWVQESSIDSWALTSSLRAKLPGVPLVLALTQQDPDLRERPQTTITLRTLDYITTGRMTVDGNFDSYWSHRGKNLRSNLRKQRSRLAKSGVHSRLEVLTMPKTMTQAVADYGRLEGSGWKNRDGTAIAGENAQGRFYSALLEFYSRRSEGLVYRYWLNDQLVASDLCIHRRGVLFMLKTAYDETQAKLSPAMLMHEAILKDIFDNARFNAIEFYGRVADWHLRLTDDVRTMYHVNCYRWAWVSRFAAARTRVIRHLGTRLFHPLSR